MEALTGLVGADFAENKPEVARERLDRQLARTPDSADLLVLSARAYERLKDVPKAEEALQERYASSRNLSVRAGGEQGTAESPSFDSLGLPYANAGNRRKAKAALEQALKLNGQFDGADEARKTPASL